MTAVSTFRQELENAVLERHCAHHPMTQKWARGELGRDALMGWGIEHYHWISNIRPSTFYKLAKAPADVREALLENLREEEAPERPHLPIVLRFAEANGADLEEVKRGRGLPTTEAWVAFQVRVARDEHWSRPWRPPTSAPNRSRRCSTAPCCPRYATSTSSPRT